MNRIYLDTSNIALLTCIKENDSTRFQKFLDEWNYRKYVLALSNAHFFEIMRCKFVKERTARFDLLERFFPVRIEHNLQENEIILALLQKGLIIDPSLSIRFFSTKIISSAQFTKYKSLDNPLLRDVCNIKYEAFKTIWKLTPKDENLKDSKSTRFSELPETKMPLEHLEYSLVQGKQFLEDEIKTEASKYKNIPREVIEFEVKNARDIFEMFFTKISKVGMKQAFAECFEIDLNNRKIQKSFIDHLLVDFKFKSAIKAVLQNLFHDIYEREIRDITSKISLKNCPGTWLENQVRIHLLKANLIETSNELDIHHISHLPYVHLLFTDKRIVEMTTQVLRGKDLPKLLRGITHPISISNTIEALEKALLFK